MIKKINRFKTLFIWLMAGLVLADPVAASVEFHKIEVKQLVEKPNNDYLLIFKPLGDMAGLSKTRFSCLHIRFNPHCVTRLKQGRDPAAAKRQYLAAVDELRNQLSASPIIIFGLKSGKGFHVLPGSARENHYQCHHLSVLTMSDRNIVYAVHADVNDGACY